jgi:hypothetical protein
MDLTTPPPDAPLQRKDYFHEGFYLRLGVGPGFAVTNVNDTTSANRDVSGSSFALATDLMIGVMPAPSMAVGGALLSNIAIGMSLKDSAPSSVSSSAQFHYLVGPAFDAFPDPRGGFHLGAAAGLAGAVLGSPPGLPGSMLGFGGAAWVGYDMWIAPEWSTGLLLRGNGAYLGGSNADGATFGASLLINVLAN